MDHWALFVEGKADERFFHCLLVHEKIDSIKIHRIGGVTEKFLLHNVANQIAQEHNKGRKVAVVLDADKDSLGRRVQLDNEIEKGELPIETYFLVPDNESPGKLETLLEKIAVEQHKVIFECFEKYQQCLVDRDCNYKPPKIKAMIFAYCEALGAEPKEEDRDYWNEDHWNLNAAALDPLKNFLHGLVDHGDAATP